MSTAIATDTQAASFVGYQSAPTVLFQHWFPDWNGLHLAASGDTKPRPLAIDPEDDPATTLDHVARGGHERVWLRTTDYERLLLQVNSQLEPVAADRRLDAADRFAIVQQALNQKLGDRIDRAGVDAYVRFAHQAGSLVAKICGDGPPAAADLFALALHEPSALCHATNSAAYLVFLWRSLSDPTPEELVDVAVGAALHPLGGRGTAKEPDDAGAPQRGYEALHSRDDVTFAQRMMVYQHREWISGEGGPVAILGDEIHPWAKALAVVDLFDDLTTDRPNRPAVRPTEALSRVGKLAFERFDPEVVRCWMSLFDQRSQPSTGNR